MSTIQLPTVKVKRRELLWALIFGKVTVVLNLPDPLTKKGKKHE